VFNNNHVNMTLEKHLIRDF